MLVFSLVTRRYKSEQPNALAHQHLYNVNTQIQNRRTKIDLNSAEFFFLKIIIIFTFTLHDVPNFRKSYYSERFFFSI